jgi:CRISPR-associated protein Csb1
LSSTSRLLIDARLQPVQGDRFQPAGFPDLGPATYTLADGTEMLLVESCQSMANLTEAVCWDDVKAAYLPTLEGLPYVHVDIVGNGDEVVGTTASVLEAHRLNSPYLLEGRIGERTFQEVFLEASGCEAGKPVDRARFLAAVFRFDPATLLHGVFMSFVEDARMRLARAMSSFIEARDVRVAQSGGVKNDRVNVSGETAKGFGNVPFARTEFTAAAITAYFNLDLRQIRSYGLPGRAGDLLQLLALYKILRVLQGGLRRRTACDLDVRDVVVTAPAGYTLPLLTDVEAALHTAIDECADSFADPRVTRVRFTHTAASSKVSKKAAKAAKADV